ncbi:MAG: hypothetical protein IJM21_05245 [Clostridia bacterium]|nr:hypothetical protein [Clostridia bacterium]
MKIADDAFLKELDRKAEEWKERIRRAEDRAEWTGTAYYVSSDGNDGNDGTSPAKPWKSLARVTGAALMPGDAVRFRRGDVFRGQVVCRPGVTYAAFGEGEKPRIYGWERNLADPALWELWDGERRIYRLRDRIPDCGTLVFNDGERHSRKLIPSWIDGRFVCRDRPDVPFLMREEMTEDLDLFCDCRALWTTAPSHGESRPVPDMRAENRGDLYLRSDRGNPGSVFESIEALPGRHLIRSGEAPDVHIDNLCLRYGGAHAISAGGRNVRGLHVTNCEIGWIGGTVQHYLGTDPNYPEGKRGTVTRYGNGVEIYGGCEDYLCENNYVYQVYDAGLTHQYTVQNGETCVMKDVRYAGNLIERCVYSIEYFLSGTEGTGSRMDGLTIENNFLRYSGYGWGQQRHNFWTPAHVKSWNFENPACRYSIRGNVFDRARYRLLHLCCKSGKDYPVLNGNTYIQVLGLPLGQFGSCEAGDPPVLAYLESSDREIAGTVGDREAVSCFAAGSRE